MGRELAKIKITEIVLEFFFQARKKSTKINFLGPETARWGRGLPREGVVAENFVPSLKSLSSLGFEERNPGCPRNFAGMSRTPGGVQKLRAKKVRAHFSLPIFGCCNSEPRFECDLLTVICGDVVGLWGNYFLAP